MFPRLLIAVFLSIPFASAAATSTWEAFDSNTCKHWSITNDYVGKGEAFQNATKLLQKLKQTEPSENWFMLEGGKLFEIGTEEYGICKLVPGVLTCRSDTAFPLAGAIFTENQVKTLSCSKGCEKLTINTLYERGSSEGTDSKDLAAATKKFLGVCQENKKRMEFIEQLKQRISK